MCRRNISHNTLYDYICKFIWKHVHMYHFHRVTYQVTCIDTPTNTPITHMHTRTHVHTHTHVHMHARTHTITSYNIQLRIAGSYLRTPHNTQEHDVHTHSVHALDTPSRRDCLEAMMLLLWSESQVRRCKDGKIRNPVGQLVTQPAG